jgi:hypothetical protein
MGDTALSTYIAGLIKKGYDPEYIRTQLIKQGYPPAEVNQALRQNKPAKKVNKILLFGSLGGITIVAIIIALFFIFPSDPAADIQFTVQSQDTTISQDDPLEFSAQLTNTVDTPTTVLLRYSIIAQGATRPIQVQQDSITVRKNAASPAKVIITSLTPGKYELAAEAIYDGKQKKDSFSFTVTARAHKAPDTVTLAQCPAGCDDFNACTEDFCQEGRCVAVSITPCCGNNICDQGESVLTCSRDCSTSAPTTSTSIIGQARSVVLSSKEDAADLCNRISYEVERDDCFSAMAQESKDPLFCGPLLSLDRKDACYLTFALDGDQGVCTKIVDARLQATCFQYAQFSRIATQA